MDILMEVSRHVALNKVSFTKSWNIFCVTLCFRKAMYQEKLTWTKRSKYPFCTQL